LSHATGLAPVAWASTLPWTLSRVALHDRQLLVSWINNTPNYYNQDPIITSLVTIKQYYKKDLSLTEYIDYRKTSQNINTNSKLKMQSSIIKINL
jgi:hypothetical protein